MLLVGADDDEVGARAAVEVLHEAVVLVDGVIGGSTVARQRHPTAVGQQPMRPVAVADHADQHRQRDVVDVADAEPRHHQVREHEHAGADLGDTIEPAGEARGRRRADADDRAGVAGAAQAVGGGDDGGAFAFGHRHQRCLAAAFVRGAGMRHHPAQFAAAGECARDRQQRRGVGLHAGAVAVAVDLDHGRDALPAFGNVPGGIEAVDGDDQVAAACAQRLHRVELVRGQADRVEDVAEAVREAGFGLGQRRHGDRRAFAGGHRQQCRQRLAGLHVRTQRHTEAVQVRAQHGDVVVHALGVEHEARRPQLVDRRRWHPRNVASRRRAARWCGAGGRARVSVVRASATAPRCACSGPRTRSAVRHRR